MLKVLFAGGGIAGFVLAAVLGLGYNPLSGGDSKAASSAPAPAAPVAAPAKSVDSPLAIESTPEPGPLQAIQELVPPGITDFLAPLLSSNPDAPSDNMLPSIQSLLDIFTELTGIKTDGNQSDLRAADLLKLFGQ